MKSSWNIAGIWNKALEEAPERERKKRDYIWASELGGSYVDRWLKLKGEIPTNPPNARSKRKFEAGNVMEGIVKLILSRAGILISSQDYIVHEYPDLLKVTGKLDVLAGGIPNIDRAKKALAELKIDEWFGEGFSRAALAVVEHLQAKHPNGLKHVVYEVKSTSGFMYEVREKRGADPHHVLQLYHYLKGLQYPEGHILYISKDDLRLMEIPVFLDSPTEAVYRQDIEQMTAYYRSDVQPPLEKKILWNETDFKFKNNYKIEYSGYLTRLYGYETPEDYRKDVDPKIGRFNRVCARVKEGKPMTKNNEEAIEEMKAYSPEILDILYQKRDELLADQEKLEAQSV